MLVDELCLPSGSGVQTRRTWPYDMWSAGVVWLEMLLGTPHVFQVSSAPCNCTCTRACVHARTHKTALCDVHNRLADRSTHLHVNPNLSNILFSPRGVAHILLIRWFWLCIPVIAKTVLSCRWLLWCLHYRISLLSLTFQYRSLFTPATSCAVNCQCCAQFHHIILCSQHHSISPVVQVSDRLPFSDMKQRVRSLMIIPPNL